MSAARYTDDETPIPSPICSWLTAVTGCTAAFQYHTENRSGWTKHALVYSGNSNQDEDMDFQ